MSEQFTCTKCGHGIDEHHQAGCRHLTPTDLFLRVRCSCRVNPDRPSPRAAPRPRPTLLPTPALRASVRPRSYSKAP